eukprot:3036022-Karenia_brevis.AAC.1
MIQQRRAHDLDVQLQGCHAATPAQTLNTMQMCASLSLRSRSAGMSWPAGQHRADQRWRPPPRFWLRG